MACGGHRPRAARRRDGLESRPMVQQYVVGQEARRDQRLPGRRPSSVFAVEGFFLTARPPLPRDAIANTICGYGCYRRAPGGSGARPCLIPRQARDHPERSRGAIEQRRGRAGPSTCARVWRGCSSVAAGKRRSSRSCRSISTSGMTSSAPVEPAMPKRVVSRSRNCASPRRLHTTCERFVRRTSRLPSHPEHPRRFVSPTSGTICGTPRACCGSSPALRLRPSSRSRSASGRTRPSSA